MKNTFLLHLLVLAVITMVSCKKKSDDDTQPADKYPAKTEFLTTYANIAYASHTQAQVTAETLLNAINSFTADPSAAKLLACKEAYGVARVAYLQCEVFRGVSGPLDGEDGAPEAWINSWPLDEAFIDYVFDNGVNTDTIKTDGKLSGIVNDLSTAITKENLLGLNFKDDGETNVATGFHAIEFLLWGQDVYTANAGQRPYTDYLTTSAATAPNGDRRATYLKVAAQLLVENLTTVAKAWNPIGGSYRSEFLNFDNRDSRLQTVISGMTKLSKNEFGGERILPGLELGDQEEEHSCFSDLTKADFKYDATGYANIINGTYASVSGTGLIKLVESFSADNAAKVKIAVDSLIITSNAVYNLASPYDQIILTSGSEGDKEAVRAMSNAWIKLSDALNLASQSIGYGKVDTSAE